MLLLGNVFSISLMLITFLASICVYLWVIKPYTEIAAHKGPGVSTHFFPFYGFFNYLVTSLHQRGDIFGATKQSSADCPNQKYMVTHLGRNLLFMLRDPPHLKEFLLKPSLYKKAKFIEVARPMMANGVVMVEGNLWKQHRKVIANSFHYEFLKSNIGMIQDVARSFLDRVTDGDMKDYSIINRAQAITGEVIGVMFFGTNFQEYTFEGKPLTLALSEVFGELAETRRSPLVVIFGPSVITNPLFRQFKPVLARVKKMRKLFLSMIEARKQQPPTAHSDLLAHLLGTQTSVDPNVRYSDEDIIDEFTTFFVGGMDTTGHLIGMTLYNLHHHPQYKDELKQERDLIYNDLTASSDILHKMDVLHSHLKETMRMYNPSPMLHIREALEDHELLGLQVKKGDFLGCDFFALFFDARYHANPEEYNPQRWRDASLKQDPYAFTPFSGGPRNCIGQHLALLEARIIISEFLERFEYKVKDGYKLKMTSRFLYEPMDELLLDLRPLSK